MFRRISLCVPGAGLRVLGAAALVLSSAYCAEESVEQTMIVAQAAAVDECDSTQQCVVIHGSSATDCFDSRSDQSVCMCGSSPCVTASEDECDSTAECRSIHGNAATDCFDSASDQSVCMCGNEPCVPDDGDGGPGDSDECDSTVECQSIYGGDATDCLNSASDQSVCMCGDTACSDGNDGGDDGNDGGDDDPIDFGDVEPIPANTQDIYDQVKDNAYYVDGGAGNDSGECTSATPCRTLGYAMAKLNAGGKSALVIHGGTYRESIHVQRSGVTIIGAPNESIVLNGSTVVTSYTNESGLIRIPVYLQLKEQPTQCNYAANGYVPPVITQEEYEVMYPHMVYANGEPMTYRSSNANLSPGEFAVDYTRSGACSNPFEHTITAFWVKLASGETPASVGLSYASRPELIGTGGAVVSGVTIAGLNLMYGANTDDNKDAWGGLLNTHRMSNSTFRDLKVAYANCIGASFRGNNNVYRRIGIIANGCEGVHAAELTNSKIIDCQFIGNSWKKPQIRWGAGGIKVTHSSSNNDFIGNVHANNRGAGLWFDIYNPNNLICHSRFENNHFAGLFIEHNSDDSTVLHNVAYGTVENDNVIYPGVDPVGAGIYIASSGDNLVRRNTSYGNALSAIHIKHHDRRGPTDGQHRAGQRVRSQRSRGDEHGMGSSVRQLYNRRTQLDGVLRERLRDEPQLRFSARISK